MATLQDYYNQLAPIYEPQVASLKAQEAGLAPQYQAQKSALEQARINAFRNISNTASARGMAFSGFTPEQEAQYTGTTYLPAMANLETQQLKSKQSLIDAINAANSERYAKAMGLSESAQQAEAANQAAIEAARIKATATAYSRSSGGSTRQPTQAERTSILKEQLAADIAGAFNSSKSKTPYFTERTVLPTLYQQYAALGNDMINKLVYQYRKNALGY